MQASEQYKDSDNQCDKGDKACNQMKAKIKRKKDKSKASASISSTTNNIGQVIDPGNYCGGYCAAGGGLAAYTTGTGTYGDSIGSVPLAYGASYDVNVYENLMVITLHEQYWMPSADMPNMDSASFGRSVLVSQLTNGQQVKTKLGEFTPGNVAHPEIREHRDTSIQYYGKENFPTGLVVSITFGAENVRATTVYYNLPFNP